MLSFDFEWLKLGKRKHTEKIWFVNWNDDILSLLPQGEDNAAKTLWTHLVFRTQMLEKEREKISLFIVQYLYKK